MKLPVTFKAKPKSFPVSKVSGSKPVISKTPSPTPNTDSLKGEALIKLLQEADHIYFNTDEEPLMSDMKYDSLYQKAKAQNPKHPYFKTVGAPQVSRDKIQLPIKMPGLSKFTPDTLGPFISNSGKPLSGDSLITEKIDGVSALLIYNNGILQKAYTRGDDSEGRDITVHARHITGIPKELKYFDGVNCCSGALTGAFAVRGELSIPKNTFESLKKKGKLITNKGKSTENEYSNPRSATVGLLNRQDPSDLLKYIVFVPFSIEESTIGLTVLEAWRELENLFEWPVYGKIVPTDIATRPDDMVKLITDLRTHSEFYCDGIVFSVDALNTGMHKNERVAVKLPAKDQAKINGVRSTVKHVEVTMSSRNLAKPRIIIEPVEIDGVVIESITGNNMREIEEYKIGPGSKVTVVRAGDVIPHIVKPKSKDDPDNITPSKKYTLLTRCPDCNHTLKWTYTRQGKQGADLQCTDELCLTNKLTVNFFLKLGVQDVGEANLASLVDALREDGFAGTVKDLLEQKPVFYQDVLGKNLGNKTREALFKALECDHAKVMYASGIFSEATLSLGADTLRKFIADLMVSIDDLLDMNTKDIEKVMDNFFMTDSKRLFKIRMPVFADFYDTIYEYHKPAKTTDTWKGRVYCFTGFRNDEAVDEIISRGGRYVSSMTKQVTHLVYASVSKKLEQARSQGCTLMTPHEFDQSLNG